MTANLPTGFPAVSAADELPEILPVKLLPVTTLPAATANVTLAPVAGLGVCFTYRQHVPISLPVATA